MSKAGIVNLYSFEACMLASACIEYFSNAPECQSNSCQMAWEEELVKYSRKLAHPLVEKWNTISS